MSPEQKQQKVAQLTETLFAMEVDEAALMFSAWHEGQSVEVGPIIQPAAILAIKNVVPRAMPSGTTGSHAFDVRY